MHHSFCPSRWDLRLLKYIWPGSPWYRLFAVTIEAQGEVLQRQINPVQVQKWGFALEETSVLKRGLAWNYWLSRTKGLCYPTLPGGNSGVIGFVIDFDKIDFVV